MGKLNLFGVDFSNVLGLYYAGQTVQGHVVIELEEAMKMRGVHLKLLGKAYVHWTETSVRGSGNHQHQEMKHFNATEIYFDHHIRLAGRGGNDSGQEIGLPAGRHVFPFTFQLPPNLPSSFEGEYGYVRFTAKGTIDKPWKFDHTTKRPFTIISLLDLNREPSANKPVRGDESKQFCCLCCTTGPVSVMFSVDRRGYVPGEAILIKAEVDNKSNRKMNSASVGLSMTTIFRSTTKTRTTTRKVANMKHAEISEGETDYWNGDQLVIPPLPPSYLVGCNIIDIRYTLELRVDPAGPGFDLVVPLGIIIGTIPLRQVLVQSPPLAPPVGQPLIMPHPGFHPTPAGSYPPGQIQTAETIPSAPAYPSEMPSNIPNMPPPSFGECVFGKVDIKDEDDNEYTRGNCDYTPVYTYYNWGHRPSTPPL